MNKTEAIRLLVEAYDLIQYDLPPCANGPECDHCQRIRDWQELMQNKIEPLRRKMR